MVLFMTMTKDYLILGDGGLFFFDKVDSLVPEGTRPVRVNVEVAGNVWRDHHRLRLVAVKKCLQYLCPDSRWLAESSMFEDILF